MFVRKIIIIFEEKVVMKIIKIFRVTIQEPPSGTKQPYFEEWETDSLLRKEKRVQII